MNDPTLSPQQRAVIDAHLSDPRLNISVNAVAGSGKTFMAIEAARATKRKRTLFVAFTNAAKDTIMGRTHGELAVKTSYSMGLTALRSGFQNVKVEQGKYSHLLKHLLSEKSALLTALGLWDSQNVIVKEVEALISQYQLGLGTVLEQFQSLILQQDTMLDPSLTFDLYYDLATRAVVEGHQQFLNEGLISFGDMISYPYYYGDSVIWEKHQFCILDEDQDFSPAQAHVAKSIVAPNGQVLLVGDPYQWIYGFAGALHTSHDDLRKTFNAVSLPLSVNYRCDREIIKMAQRYVPEIQAHDGAGKGEVRFVEPGVNLIETIVSLSNYPALVINRANAPLIGLACSLFKSGIKFKFNGDKLVSKFLGMVFYYKASLPFKQFRESIEGRIENLVELNPAHPSIDILDSLLILLDTSSATNYYRLEQHIKSVMAGDDLANITLSTIHKSKGTEMHTVLFTGYGKLVGHYMTTQNEGDELKCRLAKNLLYVGITRAKHRLFLQG